MKGSSQAFLANVSDGRSYVIKMPSCVKGPNTLCNEVAGYEVYRSLGLPVPDWKCVSVRSGLTANSAECWRTTADAKPSLGPSFASRFLGDRPAYNWLPRSMFDRIENRQHFWLAWVVDSLSNHCDSREAVFVPRDSGLTAVFIDHSLMFGGSHGSASPLPSRARYWDPRIYSVPDPCAQKLLLERLKGFDAGTVLRNLTSLPEEWKSPSALSAISDSLDRLSDCRLLRSTLECLVDEIRALPGRSESCQVSRLSSTLGS